MKVVSLVQIPVEAVESLTFQVLIQLGPVESKQVRVFSAGDTLESFGSDQFCSEPVFGVMDESTLDSLVAESADGSEGQQHEILDEELYPPGDVNAAGSQTQPSGPTDSFVDHRPSMWYRKSSSWKAHQVFFAAWSQGTTASAN